MSSIKAEVHELQAIQNELKALNIHRKKLLKRSKEIQINITDFLIAKEQPGMKYQDKEIRLQQKPIRAPKKPKERDQDAIDVLERYGIHDSVSVLKELLEARKGQEIQSQTIKIKNNVKN